MAYIATVQKSILLDGNMMLGVPKIIVIHPSPTSMQICVLGNREANFQ